MFSVQFDVSLQIGMIFLLSKLLYSDKFKDRVPINKFSYSYRFIVFIFEINIFDHIDV